jgi:signal transduction histidine kinase
MQQLIKSILTTFANEVKTLVPTLVGMDTAPDVESSARGVVDSLAAATKTKGISLHIDADPALAPWKVVGEAERLERVIFNLMANAVRHSDSGQCVMIRLRDLGEWIETSVEDEGDGVPEAFVPGLFERFSQGSGNTGQAGLGLYYCRITVENWGGSIGYRPADGGGACFWFRLHKPLPSDQLPDEQPRA